MKVDDDDDCFKVTRHLMKVRYCPSYIAVRSLLIGQLFAVRSLLIGSQL